MMNVRSRPSAEITEVIRTKDGLLLKNALQSLLLQPIAANIVRIRCTRQNEFAQTDKPFFLKHAVFGSWSFSENDESIELKTSALTVSVNRKSGSVSYRKPDGTLLTQEREHDSRELEPFDSYRIAAGQPVSTEEIQTPDGVKKVVREAARVFDRKLFHTRVHWQWQQGEALYGLGQNDTGCLNLRGTVQYLHQANRKIALPFLLSSRGYGILLSTGSPSVFHDTVDGSYLYTEAEEEIDFYFLVGNMDETVKAYRFLTGQAALLPRWAFGYVQSQECYETQAEILSVAEEYHRRGIGLDCIVQDWNSWEEGLWGQKSLDKKRYPDAKAMVAQLHRDGIHFIISIWPTMDPKCENYKEFSEKGMLLPGSDIYDALDPEARKIYWAQAERGLFSYGIDGWWCDSSEPWTPEWNHMVKPEPFRMYEEFNQAAAQCLPADLCNAYGFFHALTIWEGQRKSTEEKRVLNLTRNAYTGQQRFGTILWSGDISASWNTLRSQIPAGLNLCASGQPYWTLDAGGFFTKHSDPWFWDGDYNEGWNDKGYCELAVRWFQYAAFLPVFRGHGTDIRREWWLAGEKGSPFYDALCAVNRLRYRLLPYIYSLAGNVMLNGCTMHRMLAFDFPDDPAVLDLKDEFLLGSALLVCPVTTPMYYGTHSQELAGVSKTRRVYLPRGCDWVDFWTNVHYHGGQTITADAPLDRIPLYVKVGSILPMAEDALSTEEAFSSPCRFVVYPGADGHFMLYEDAGDGYGYEKGEYAATELHWDDAAKALTFSPAKGSWQASVPPEKRRVEIVKTLQRNEAAPVD